MLHLNQPLPTVLESPPKPQPSASNFKQRKPPVQTKNQFYNTASGAGFYKEEQPLQQ
jgi:hypothetical protein